MRVVKYRGSADGTNSFRFSSATPASRSFRLHLREWISKASTERVSTGVESLDGMFGGKGYLRGTSVLISGTAGTGKTSLAGHFAAAACKRGEKCLYFSFEEGESQLVRNFRSIGLDLAKWIDVGRLQVHSSRPTRYGLEMHLATMYHRSPSFGPKLWSSTQ